MMEIKHKYVKHVIINICENHDIISYLFSYKWEFIRKNVLYLWTFQMSNSFLQSIKN